MSFLKKILLEGRESDFRLKYQSKFSPEQLDAIVKMSKLIPNGTKFLNFLGKALDTNITDESLDLTKKMLKKFISVGPNLTKTDINQYESLQELSDELKNHENRIRRQVEAIEGANIVYEDDRFTIVNPLTYKASCYYGAGTKWCTASETTPNHYVDHNREGKLFYIIDKTLPTSNKFYKVALEQKYDGTQKFFDAPDQSFTKGWIFGTPEFEKLMLAVDAYMQDNFSEQLQIFADKERAQKERERLRRERELQIRRQKLEIAQERREEGEWDIEGETPRPSSMAALAHVFLEFCEENGEEIKTPEVELTIANLKREIQDIDGQIAQLNDEYDADENVRRDLLDKIEELEERKEAIEGELEDYDSYIDVYNCIPEGEYYNMQQFVLIGGSHLSEDAVFAVGTYDDAYDSAIEYVEGLVDDAGVQSFSEWFYKEYLDTDEIESYLRDFFSSDVYDNPDVYLDDSERELSYDQEKQIRENNEKIRQLTDQLENLEPDLEDYDEQYSDLENEIQELEDENESIESEPEGDFDEDKIEEAIQDKVDEYVDDFEDFYNQFFGDREFGSFLARHNMIDIDELCKGAVDSDGIGHHLNRYDGSEDEINMFDTTYIVVRTD
jgi:DNA repair exonuclease SbcCD ATPase subunit